METQSVAIYLAKQFNRQAAESCPRLAVPEITFIKVELVAISWGGSTTGSKFLLMVSCEDTTNMGGFLARIRVALFDFGCAHVHFNMTFLFIL